MNEITDNYWHKQPLIWLIIGLLGATMLASFGMLFLAATNAPDLVIEDYANIEELTNKTRAQDQLAADLGLEAVVRSNGTAVQVVLTSTNDRPLPATIVIRTHNSTRAALDTQSMLQGAEGYYGGTLQFPDNAYDLHIEDTDSTWRLSKRMFGQPGETRLAPFVPGR